MNLSKVTIEILKNFHSINQGLVFCAGNTLRTINVTKSIYAEATVPDTFPMDFAIYDLGEFLSAYSKWDSVEMEFKPRGVSLIKKEEGTPKTQLFYRYSPINVITTPGKSSPSLPSVDLKFTLTPKVFQDALNMSSLLKFSDLIISKDGITVCTDNKDAPPEDDPTNLTIGVEVEYDDPEASAIFKIENLKLMSVVYEVKICSRGIAEFTSVDPGYPIKYLIALTAR